MKKITADELKELLRHSTERFACIDVRERVEYEKKQIFHTSQLSRREIENRIQNLVPDKKTRIILYSNEEGRSSVIAGELSEAGYEDVSILAGGLTKWEEDGYETVYGVHVYSKVFGEIVAEHFREVPFIHADDLAKELERAPSDYRIVDIRPREEVVQTGSIPGAINLPGFEAIIKLPDLEAEGKRVIFTCAGRTRGIIATATARRLGYQVLDLENGTLGWRLTGRKLQKDISPGEAPSDRAAGIIKGKINELISEEGISAIDASELKKRLDKNNVIALDTRQIAAFEDEGHIPGSRHLAGGQAVQNEDEARYIHNEDIVFIDDHEIRSALAAWWYRRMGIGNVLILKGGIDKWQADGHSLDKGSVKNRKLYEHELKSPGSSGIGVADRIDQADRDIRLIDVREGRRYYRSHIDRSIWIPLGRLEERIEKAVPAKDTHLYLKGEDPEESVHAACILHDAGYRDIRILGTGADGADPETDIVTDSSSGQILDDWWVTLSEYGTEEARRYFNWEESLISTYKYIEEFVSLGVIR